MEHKNLPDRIDEFVTEVLNRDPLLPAAISAVPYFGGPIATFLSGKELRLYRERTAELLQQLSEHLSSIDERAIKRDYFDTPEGMDLLIRALDESSRTRSEEKRDLIARILAGATSTDAEQGNYSPEEYVNLVANLTVKELEVARIIYDSQRNLTAKELDADNRLALWNFCREDLIGKHGIDTDDLPMFVNRLHNVGLLDLHYVQTPGSPTPTYWTSPTSRRAGVQHVVTAVVLL